MAITLTEAAASRVKAFLDQRGKGVGLRLGVKTTGCSGMAYVMEYADVVEADDAVFEDHGVKVFVDPQVTVLPGWHGTGFCSRGPQRGSAVPQSQFVGRVWLRGNFHRITLAV